VIGRISYAPRGWFGALRACGPGAPVRAVAWLHRRQRAAASRSRRRPGRAGAAPYPRHES